METNQTASLLFFGDFGISNPRNISIGLQLQDEIDKSDIVGINFEGCINSGKIISPTGRAIPQSSDSAKWCKDRGISLFSLANNHIMDFGETGFLQTVKLFQKDCTIVGAGTYEEAYRPKYFLLNDIKIGFLAGTSADFSSLKSRWDDGDKYGCAWIKSPEFTLSILNAIKQCDHLFIISHAGVEHFDIPIPEWRDLYRFWIDLGVSGVIASHPHVPQGKEIYKGRPIYYSLGNFIFEGSPKKSKPKHWHQSIGAKVIMTKNEILYAESLPILFDGVECNIDQSEQTILHLKSLNSILTDDIKYLNRVNTEIPKFAEKYISYILNSMNAVKVDRSISSLIRYLKKFIKNKNNEKILLHQLREESTSTTLIRYLKNNTKSYL